MPRRKSESDRLLDDVFALLREAPWWVGPPFILIAWGLSAIAIPGFLEQFGEGREPPLRVVSDTLGSVSTMVSPFIAAIVAIVWLVALIQKAVDGRRLDRQTGIESIRNLSWRDFEHLLAEGFRRQRYGVSDTGAGVDGGIDLILEKAGRRTLVQAKQWKARKVGVRPVRELFGVQTSEGADSAIIVTSGNVTAEARRFADSNGVQVIEGEALLQMIRAVQRRRPQPAVAAPTKHESTEPTDDSPACPACGAQMLRRIAKRGARAGQPFWGCSSFPGCRGTRPV